MNRPLRLALAQIDCPVDDMTAQADRLAAHIAEARDRHHADLWLGPELGLCGYPADDLLERPAFLDACERALARVAAVTQGITALVGVPTRAADGRLRNSLAVLRDGAVVARAHKQVLPNTGVFDERRHFVPADATPALLDLAGTPAGLLVCEDLWHDGPARAAVDAGARLLLVANASPYEADKAAERAALLARRARELGVAIAYVNRVGGQDELVFDGGSLLADADGHVHPPAQAFVDHTLLATFDPAAGRFQRAHWPLDAEHSRPALHWGAMRRGLADYVRRNGFRRVLLGLSGGIDSSLILALAVDALGPDAVQAVRLPSRYTSDLSNDLAAQQAMRLGVQLDTIPIAAPFEGFLQALAPSFAGLAPDVTEENLQSRCRGAILMALSNKHGALLLTTGNKSEVAVGYATIYGDMCGGYAPIKDLYKTEVYALARWRNAQGDGEVIPAGVIGRAPSAELREQQTDQDSLPPYATLDAILARHIEGREDAAAIIDAGFDAATVERVLRLVRISEWKRAQAAPGPKLSRCAFGRERRVPISRGRG